MPWGMLIGGAVSLIGNIFSSSNQASAAQSAAQQQQQAATAQLGLASNVFNTQGQINAPTRLLGGEAQSREAYLLGLDPNLNIAASTVVPNISVNPQTGQSVTTYNSPIGGQTAVNPNAVLGGTGGTTTTGTTGGGTQPVLFGGQYYGGVNPTTTPIGGSGVPIPSTGATGGVTGGAATGTAGAATSVTGSPGYGSYANTQINPYNPSTFYQDPGYQFILAQNEQQIKNQQAIGGNAVSPASLTAAMSYSSGLASQEFNNAYQRSMQTQTTQLNANAMGLNELNALATGGQVATSGLTTAAGNAGTAGSSALAGYGNAGAAGTIGAANAVSSGINNATNTLLGANYSTGGIVANSNNNYGGLYGGINSAIGGVNSSSFQNTYYPSGGLVQAPAVSPPS